MTDVDVFIDTAGSPRRVGTAHVTRSRGRVSTTFLYDPAYLVAGGDGIDPSLRLDPGTQYYAGLLRAFADTAPDRWGRNLIAKAERTRAREENRAPRRLDDLDYLLGVSDNTRQGALRFRLPGHADFLGEPSTVPRLVSLPALLRAGERVETDDDPADGEQRDYVDLAESVRDLSPSPRHDLHELFSRVVGSVALGNTDDHLRNHGFLANRGSWTLSPAFDVNPNPDPMARRATSIVGADTLPDEVDGLAALAEDCDLPQESARERMGAIADRLAPWRECARRNRVPEREITMMAEAVTPRLEALVDAARAG